MDPKKKIAAFCCENSAFKIIDSMADSDLLDYMEIIKLPCSGRIEIKILLKCIEEGYSSVLVLGCPKDNCKYLNGNRRAEKRVRRAKMSLRDAGYDESIIGIDFVSSVDDVKLKSIIAQKTEVG